MCVATAWDKSSSYRDDSSLEAHTGRTDGKEIHSEQENNSPDRGYESSSGSGLAGVQVLWDSRTWRSMVHWGLLASHRKKLRNKPASTAFKEKESSSMKQ